MIQTFYDFGTEALILSVCSVHLIFFHLTHRAETVKIFLVHFAV